MSRLTPKQLAMKLVKTIQKQDPDENYLKKTFEHVRYELKLKSGKGRMSKKLPELMTEEELKRFYDSVWHHANPTHMVMIKLLMYTGIRNSELVNLLIEDVDLTSLKLRITKGKGDKDRYVLIPPFFKGELGLYIASQKDKKAVYLFESNRKDKFTTRWLSEIVRTYALEAGITKRIYPHLLRHQLLTFLTSQGLIDAKLQLLSGHGDRKSLSIYQDLSLADVEKDYAKAMKSYPIQ